ncbi:MAG: hypothetical protein IIC66_10915 [candidate division Zixibacteria bacterium]|nr:hypothetical protein [candidate division Zixibacteria bacterium]
MTEQVIEWQAAGGGDAVFNLDGSDSVMLIELKSDGNTQTIDIEKTFTSEDSEK